MREKLKDRYLVPGAPSVFEEYPPSVQRIEPIQLLFNWRAIGQGAENDQHQYLLNLLSERPANLDAFLKQMFRVDFIDDYDALKPLIDYKELAGLIEENLDILDPKNVKHFKKRYAAEQQQTKT